MRSYLARFAFRGDDVFADDRRTLGRREGSPHAGRRDEAAPQPAPARRAHEPPRPRLPRSARGVAGRLSGLDRVRVARPGLHRPAGDARHRPARRAGDAPAGQLHRDGRRAGRAPQPARARAAAAQQARSSGARPRPRRPRRRKPAAPRPARAAADCGGDKEARAAAAGSRRSRRRSRALETEIEAIETRLWEEALTLGPVAAHELSKQKAAKEDELDDLIEEWARLSEEAEQAAPRTS